MQRSKQIQKTVNSLGDNLKKEDWKSLSITRSAEKVWMFQVVVWTHTYTAWVSVEYELRFYVTLNTE